MSPETRPIQPPFPTPEASGLERQLASVGEALLSSFRDLLAAIPGQPTPGPQALARALSLDKVLTSRVLKATRSQDPISALAFMPGPDPLRRLLRAAIRRGLPAQLAPPADAAIDAFEALIRDTVGDRSLLDSILSAWIPEARREFELRRKQSLFKAMSQLKGVQADALAATVAIHPSARDGKNDIVWINGLIGVHRVRPGAPVKLTTRRMPGETPSSGRRPVSLDGAPVEHVEGLLLPEFCTTPTPRLRVQRAGEVVHYTLPDRGVGPATGVDVVFAEANIAELERAIPANAGRLHYFFAENVTPAKVLQFDVLIHDDLYTAGGAPPELRLYDTSFEGVASPNNPSRDIDRLDMLESAEDLGRGLHRFRSGDIPRYADLLAHVFQKMRWDGARFRAHRVRIDYPVYGSQVMLAFKPDERAE